MARTFRHEPFGNALDDLELKRKKRAALLKREPLPDRPPAPTGIFTPTGEEFEAPADTQQRKMASIVDQKQKLIQSRTPGISEAAAARLAQQQVAPKPDTTFEEDIARQPTPTATGTIEGEDVASFQAREQERLAEQESFREGITAKRPFTATPGLPELPFEEAGLTQAESEAEPEVPMELINETQGFVSDADISAIAKQYVSGVPAGVSVDPYVYADMIAARSTNATEAAAAKARLPAGISGFEMFTPGQRKLMRRQAETHATSPEIRKRFNEWEQDVESQLRQRRDELQAQRSRQFKQQIDSQKYRQTEASIKASQVSTALNILQLKDMPEPSEAAKLDAQLGAAVVEGQIERGEGAATVDRTNPKVMDKVLDDTNATIETRKTIENQRIVKSLGGAQGITRQLIGREIEAVATTSTQIEERREAFNDVISENPDMTINEVASRVYKDAIADKDLSDKAQESIAAAIGSLAQEYVITGAEPAMRELQENTARNRVNVAVGYAATGQSISAQKDKGKAYSDIWARTSNNMVNLERVIGQNLTAGQKQEMRREMPNYSRVLAEIDMNPDITEAQVDQVFKGYMVGRAGDNPAFQNEIANQFALLDSGKPTSPEFDKARNDFSAVMTKGHASVNLAKDKKRKELAKDKLFPAFEDGTSNIDETFKTEDEARVYQSQDAAGKETMKAIRAVEKVKIAKSSSVRKEIEDSLENDQAFIPVPAAGDLDYNRLVKAETTLAGMNPRQLKSEEANVLRQNIELMEARLRYQKGPAINMTGMSDADRLETLIGQMDIVKSHTDLMPEDRDALAKKFSLLVEPLFDKVVPNVDPFGKETEVGGTKLVGKSRAGSLGGWYQPSAKEPATEATPEVVIMTFPDGSQKNVPASEQQRALDMGGTLEGQNNQPAQAATQAPAPAQAPTPASLMSDDELDKLQKENIPGGAPSAPIIVTPDGRKWQRTPDKKGRETGYISTDTSHRPPPKIIKSGGEFTEVHDWPEGTYAIGKFDGVKRVFRNGEWIKDAAK